jgi:hypothetical protein
VIPFSEIDMIAKVRIVAASLVLFLYACGPSPERLIVGRWEAESTVKMTAEFSKDGTAKLTVLGQTLNGTYKVNDKSELEWTFHGTTKKMKMHVTATELEVSDDANRTVKYRKK